MARPKPELVLSDDERLTLTRWANRPKSTQRSALRARKWGNQKQEILLRVLTHNLMILATT